MHNYYTTCEDEVYTFEFHISTEAPVTILMRYTIPYASSPDVQVLSEGITDTKQMSIDEP